MSEHVKIWLPRTMQIKMVKVIKVIKSHQKSSDSTFDSPYSPQISWILHLSVIFLHPPHLFEALQRRPLNEVVGVHRLPGQKRTHLSQEVDRNGQKPTETDRNGQ